MHTKSLIPSTLEFSDYLRFLELFGYFRCITKTTGEEKMSSINLGIIDENSIGILISLTLSFSIEGYALSSYNTTKISRWQYLDQCLPMNIVRGKETVFFGALSTKKGTVQ